MSFPLEGCDRLKESILNLISTKRIPHAVIIDGDAGTGKRSLAKYLAKAFVCKSNNAPCGTCRACHLCDVESHPDIEWIRPEEKKKSVSVEKIRSLKELSHTSALSANGRVFIIENAETMNLPSQNSLLKVLEEPPANVLFILISDAAGKLLETVVSRCVVFSLFAPSNEIGLKVLTERGFDLENANRALFLEHGNIGKAILSLESNKNNLALQLAEDFLEFVLAGNSLDALLCTTQMEKDRPLASNFIFELKNLLTQKIKVSTTLPMTLKELVFLYDTVVKAEPSLFTNINLSLFFTYLTSEMIGGLS